MHSKKITFVAALAVVAAFGITHQECGSSSQDEAVALAMDAGLSQILYLRLSYGDKADVMLGDAFAARAEYFVETAEVVRHLANGDIRNVPCVEPFPKGNTAKRNFVAIQSKMKSAFFSPDEPVIVSGRMFGETNAYDMLVTKTEARTKKKIVFTGNPVSPYQQNDTNGISYSFWPLGCAIHSSDAYAEEAAHFFNATDPRVPVRNYKGTWGNPDHARVSKWNEFLAAFRGLKVDAYARGFNLNVEPTSNGDTNAVNISAFEFYYAEMAPRIDGWLERSFSPVSTNSFVLLLAYREAVGHENKDTDNAAYKRLRDLCRSCKVAQMVL